MKILGFLFIFLLLITVIKAKFNQTLLNLNWNGLTSLDGIEAYKDNLIKLDLSFNKIINIDLLAKFTQLKHLDLS